MSSVLETPATGRRQSIMLAVILVTQLMVVLDATVVTIALPKIQTALGFRSADLSWVQSAYALAFGGLLLLGARAGDILGRRRVFLTGIAVFTVASLLGGLAQTAGLLLAARALQGVGAAIAAPAALTLLIATFPEGTARNRALGYYSLVSSGGSSVGLIVGGMLTDWVSWRWALFVNVPIGIALVFAAREYLTETPTRAGRFDVVGALTSTLGITSIVYGLIRVGDHGWGNTTSLVAFAAGVALLAGFVVTERRVEQPITPLRLFLDRDRGLAYATILLVVSAMFGMFFFMSQFLQGVPRFSALQAGLAFLPLTVLLFSIARIVPRLMERVGPGRMMVTGSVLIVAGMVWLTRLTETSGYLGAVVGPMMLFGFGAGLVFIPLVSRAVSGVRPEDAGAASGLVNVIQQVGGALGLAVLVTVYGSASRSAGTGVHALAEGVGSAFTAALVFAVLTLAAALVSLRTRVRTT